MPPIVSMCMFISQERVRPLSRTGLLHRRAASVAVRALATSTPLRAGTGGAHMWNSMRAHHQRGRCYTALDSARRRARPPGPTNTLAPTTKFDARRRALGHAAHLHGQVPIMPAHRSIQSSGPSLRELHPTSHPHHHSVVLALRGALLLPPTLAFPALASPHLHSTNPRPAQDFSPSA